MPRPSCAISRSCIAASNYGIKKPRRCGPRGVKFEYATDGDTMSLTCRGGAKCR